MRVAGFSTSMRSRATKLLMIGSCPDTAIFRNCQVSEATRCFASNAWHALAPIDPREIDLRMTAPIEVITLKLQQPLLDDALMIAARSWKKDEGGLAD